MAICLCGCPAHPGRLCPNILDCQCQGDQSSMPALSDAERNALLAFDEQCYKREVIRLFQSGAATSAQYAAMAEAVCYASLEEMMACIDRTILVLLREQCRTGDTEESDGKENA